MDTLVIRTGVINDKLSITFIQMQTHLKHLIIGTQYWNVLSLEAERIKITPPVQKLLHRPYKHHHHDSVSVGHRGAVTSHGNDGHHKVVHETVHRDSNAVSKSNSPGPDGHHHHHHHGKHEEVGNKDGKDEGEGKHHHHHHDKHGDAVGNNDGKVDTEGKHHHHHHHDKQGDATGSGSKDDKDEPRGTEVTPSKHHHHHHSKSGEDATATNTDSNTPLVPQPPSGTKTTPNHHGHKIK